jgi:hypothetical protein
MTGGVLSFGISLVEHWRGASLSVIIFAGIAIAAIMSGAFLSWREKDNEVEGLKKELRQKNTMRPRLILGATSKSFRDWTTPDPYLLWIQNTGERTAAFITIEPISSISGRYTLHLTGPATLTAGQYSGLQFEVLEHHPELPDPANYPARFYIEMLWEFFKDHPSELVSHDFCVTIKCRDVDGSEVVNTMKLRCEYNPIRLRVLPS